MSRTRIAPLDRGETLAQRAYAAIRQAIRRGDLEQGETYSEAELGESMGISRTPVREALIELSREGLVEIRPQRGFCLRTLTDAEIDEVFALREVLEGHVVEQLAGQASDADVAQLRALLERQRAAAGDATAFLELDEELHLLMPRLAGLERTHGMLVDLRAVMWLVATIALSTRTRVDKVLEEHEALVAAIEARDPRAARRALRDHLRRTRTAALPKRGAAAA